MVRKGDNPAPGRPRAQEQRERVARQQRKRANERTGHARREQSGMGAAGLAREVRRPHAAASTLSPSQDVASSRSSRRERHLKENSGARTDRAKVALWSSTAHLHRSLKLAQRAGKTNSGVEPAAEGLTGPWGVAG